MESTTISSCLTLPRSLAPQTLLSFSSVRASSKAFLSLLAGASTASTVRGGRGEEGVGEEAGRGLELEEGRGLELEEEGSEEAAAGIPLSFSLVLLSSLLTPIILSLTLPPLSSPPPPPAAPSGRKEVVSLLDRCRLLGAEEVLVGEGEAGSMEGREVAGGRRGRGWEEGC